MLHACNAVDGTAKKLLPNMSNRARYTRLLRDNYAILGPMGAPGIDIEETRFPVAIIKKPTASCGAPDIADVIYTVHRCCHGHGDELPDGFSLLSDVNGPPRRTRLLVGREGEVQLSDRIIFGLLAVAVLSPANKDQACHRLDPYYLTYGATEKLMINGWWGLADLFPAVVAKDPPPAKVKLDFSN